MKNQRYIKFVSVKFFQSLRIWDPLQVLIYRQNGNFNQISNFRKTWVLLQPSYMTMVMSGPFSSHSIYITTSPTFPFIRRGLLRMCICFYCILTPSRMHPSVDRLIIHSPHSLYSKRNVCRVRPWSCLKEPGEGFSVEVVEGDWNILCLQITLADRHTCRPGTFAFWSRTLSQFLSSVTLDNTTTRGEPSQISAMWNSL